MLLNIFGIFFGSNFFVINVIIFLTLNFQNSIVLIQNQGLIHDGLSSDCQPKMIWL